MSIKGTSVIHILKRLILLLIYVHVCTSQCGFVHMHAGACSGQKCQTPWIRSYRQL